MKLSTRYKTTREYLEQILDLWPKDVRQEIPVYFEQQLIENILELIGKNQYALELLYDKSKQLLNEDKGE